MSVVYPCDESGICPRAVQDCKSCKGEPESKWLAKYYEAKSKWLAKYLESKEEK